MGNLIHWFSVKRLMHFGLPVLLMTVCGLPGIRAAIGAESINDNCQADVPVKQIIASETLDVLTLNIGHGRGRSMNQLFVTRAGHERNLGGVAVLLKRSGAHVIALQEADAPSLWSGRFDHVDFLADATGYDCFVHGHHADTWLFTFGAALMSQFPISDAGSHAFRPSWPTTTKGFVHGTVYWKAGNEAIPPRPVTLVSVHLDFSRRKVRDAQIAEMVEALTGLSTPVIILGDFNADWSKDDSAVREVASKFELRAYTPDAGNLGTYGNIKRLDWILISEELEFISYEVVPGLVSDHLALLARIGLAGDH